MLVSGTRAGSNVISVCMATMFVVGLFKLRDFFLKGESNPSGSASEVVGLAFGFLLTVVNF